MRVSKSQAITEAEGGSVMKVWLVWQGELGGERNFEGVFRTEEGAIQRVSEINDDGFPRAKDVKWDGCIEYYLEQEHQCGKRDVEEFGEALKFAHALCLHIPKVDKKIAGYE